MRSNRNVIQRHRPFLLLLVLLFAACNTSYKRSKHGVEYRIISSEGGRKLEYGNYLQFHMAQFYKDGHKDTMLADSREYMPHTEAYDTLTMPPEYPEIFHDVIEGDSVVIRIAADSFLKLNNNPALSFARSGGKFYTTFKILNIFKNRREADSATRVEFKVNGLKIFNKQLAKFEFDIQKKAVQIGSDAKKISDYLEGKKISYIRGNWGTFIVIHDEGSGEKIKFDNVVGINYTGKGLEDGKAFDSNIDPKFGHPGILEIHMNELQSIIPGLLDALMQLKKSSSATIYIPSSLGYGVNGVPPNIKSNENLVFEIEVKEVITEDSAMKIVSESRQRNDEVRRRMLDSLKHH